MIKFRLFRMEWRWSPALLVGYLAMMVLLCNLGFWQLRRADEKQALLDAQYAAQMSVALDLNQRIPGEPELEAIRYRKATLQGHYDDAHQLLLDNQVHDGRPGYLVFTPFLPANGQAAVLVNRGWLPLGRDRRVVPDLSIDTPVEQLRGRINRFPDVGIRLAGGGTPGEGWPVRTQYVDLAALGVKFGYALAPFQLELDADQPAGYLRDWRINVVIPPEKHRAYAVQWFGLALTLSTLMFWNSLRKRRE